MTITIGDAVRLAKEIHELRANEPALAMLLEARLRYEVASTIPPEFGTPVHVERMPSRVADRDKTKKEERARKLARTPQEVNGFVVPLAFEEVELLQQFSFGDYGVHGVTSFCVPSTLLTHDGDNICTTRSILSGAHHGRQPTHAIVYTWAGIDFTEHAFLWAKRRSSPVNLDYYQRRLLTTLEPGALVRSVLIRLWLIIRTRMGPQQPALISDSDALNALFHHREQEIMGFKLRMRGIIANDDLRAAATWVGATIRPPGRRPKKQTPSREARERAAREAAQDNLGASTTARGMTDQDDEDE